jgi:ABC-2 type transport system ATP-binding protein
LRVREILTFHAAYHGVPKREREQLADKLLDELGLGDHKNDKVPRFSGGMSQRLMIARALMHRPDVLFLDEPTNNLDPQSRLFLWDRIRDLNQRGLTILLTTHDMDEADRLCERIAIMDRGKILVNDTRPQLKQMVPGGHSLELHVVVADATACKRVVDALRRLPGIEKIDEISAPDQIGLYTLHIYAREVGSLVGPAAQTAVSEGAEVRDLTVKRPSLEDVFIYLTGRQLR